LPRLVLTPDEEKLYSRKEFAALRGCCAANQGRVRAPSIGAA
jgi:hypothetical protein